MDGRGRRAGATMRYGGTVALPVVIVIANASLSDPVL